MGVVQTRLTPPIEPRTLVDRARLLQRLEQADGARLSVVFAPAGYGKTSLLAQWYRKLRASGRVCGWLTADRKEADAAGFLHHLAYACAGAGVGFEPGLDRILRTEAFPSAEFLTELIVNALARDDCAIHLFIDDAHVLSPEAAQALERLLEFAPSSTAFVIAARALPDIPLARFRARGQLLELDCVDLKFTRDEVRQFMQGNAANTRDEAVVASLEECTEGWVAGIRLATLALRRGVDPKDVLSSLRGDNRSISDFFAEEVFASLAPEIQNFLVQTSILDRFSPSLCESVTGLPDARRLLQTVEARGLFLLHLDEEGHWHRYHHLFEAYLKRRLQSLGPEIQRDLHRRASRWFWEADLPAEAIAHALQAGEPQMAAEQLERSCLELTYVGKLRLVAKFAAEIPLPIRNLHPGILLTMAWLKTRALEVEAAQTLIATAEQRLEQMQVACEKSPQELRTLDCLKRYQQMVLAAASDDTSQIEAHCERLLTDYADEQHPYLRATTYGHLMVVRRQQYRIDDGERMAAATYGALRRSVFRAAAVGLQACQAPLLMLAGKTRDAESVLMAGREESIRYTGLRSSSTAVCSLLLAEIAYEGNDLARAQQLIDESWHSALSFGYVDQLQSAFVTQAKILAAQGRGSEAFGILDQGMGIAIDRRLERLGLALTAERIQQLTATHAVDDALRCAESLGLASAHPPLPGGSTTVRDEHQALIWTRLALASGRHAEGIATARRWRNFLATRHAARPLFTWNLLLARLHAIGGAMRMAQGPLQDAIAQASANRWIRGFHDEGPAIRTLLEMKVMDERRSGCPINPFTQELLQDAAGRSPPPAPMLAQEGAANAAIGALSIREREILGLVAAGYRNREVAARLGTTEGTVKWYMQQVYNKTGTRRRQHAVERARKYGLITH